MTTGLGVLLLNLHNPVYVAETVATLDIIARGNFVFGIGLGYRDVEFDAFDVPKGKRVARMVEYLELVRRLWTEDSVTHRGETCRLDAVRMNIRPVQRPSPPVWVAANNDRANPAGRAYRRHVDGQSAFDDRDHPSPARALPGGAGCGGQAVPRRGFPCIKEIYCARGPQGPPSRWAGPYLFAKYRDYASWGQGRRDARRRDVRPGVRRPAARPIHSRLAARVPRAAPGPISRSLESTTSSSVPTGRECRSRPPCRACGSSRTSCCRRSGNFDRTAGGL